MRKFISSTVEFMNIGLSQSNIPKELSCLCSDGYTSINKASGCAIIYPNKSLKKTQSALKKISNKYPEIEMVNCFMSSDFEIYGVDSYKNGQRISRELARSDFYKLLDELYDLSYFQDLDIEDEDFLKNVIDFISLFSKLKKININDEKNQAEIYINYKKFKISLDIDDELIHIEYDDEVTTYELNCDYCDLLPMFELFIKNILNKFDRL